MAIEHAIGAMMNGGGQMPAQLTTPINDIQLVATMACFIEGTPRERVEAAANLLAEAFVALGDPNQLRTIRTIRNPLPLVALVQAKLMARDAE